MKTSVLFIYVFLVFTTKAAMTVTGKIVESSSNEPLEYANIVLLSLPDSVFVTGTTSNEARLFRFDNLNSSNYLLKISFVGFEDKHIRADVSNNQVDLGEILLSDSNELGEVVITSKAPPFKSGINGGIVANVSTTLLSTVGTANDVLQQMPSVMAEEMTDVANVEHPFQLVQSIPSPKAEPFKQWLAQLGRERLEEIDDPVIGIERLMEYYHNKGYSANWIYQRLKSIEIRKELTDEWERYGIKKRQQNAVLTDNMTAGWSGMTSKQYKQFKGLRTESLRDNMTNLELVLNMLAEYSAINVISYF